MFPGGDGGGNGVEVATRRCEAMHMYLSSLHPLHRGEYVGPPLICYKINIGEDYAELCSLIFTNTHSNS